MKLYMTSERQSALPAVCPRLTAPARHVAPPSVSAPWQEFALGGIAVAQAPVAVVVKVQASVPAVAQVAQVSALDPAASVLALATESVRVDRAIRVDGLAVDGPAANEQLVRLDRRGIQVQGTSGFSTTKHGMTAPKPNGGVRGAPPRGRPV